MPKQRHREGKWIEQSFSELLGKASMVPKQPKFVLCNLPKYWFCRLKNMHKYFSRGCYVYMVKGRDLFNCARTYTYVQVYIGVDPHMYGSQHRVIN